jgi:hypothetical protein
MHHINTGIDFSSSTRTYSLKKGLRTSPRLRGFSSYLSAGAIGFILKARTVCVLIDPNAGTSINNPFGNKNAQDEVERALMAWGRFQLVQGPSTADLVIVIRKGSGKPVDRTVGNLPTNDRPVTVQQTDNTIRIGGQQGQAPGVPRQTMPQDTRPEQQTEVGPAVEQDSFTVYGPGNDMGRTISQISERSLGWRTMGKNLLKSPDVPAVSDFRKAVEETEKQQSKKSQRCRRLAACFVCSGKQMAHLSTSCLR